MSGPIGASSKSATQNKLLLAVSLLMLKVTYLPSSVPPALNIHSGFASSFHTNTSSLCGVPTLWYINMALTSASVSVPALSSVSLPCSMRAGKRW